MVKKTIIRSAILRIMHIPLLLRIWLLRRRGVLVSWEANISKTAEISCMDGIIEIGPRTTIDDGVILRAYGGHIKLGADCSVNPYTVLYGHGGLDIGNGVRIATHSVFIPANHIFSDPNEFIYKQGETIKGIIVEDDVWFGAGVRILDGTTIGKGAVIGAGSVITKDVEAFGIYAGVPAKKIASRI